MARKLVYLLDLSYRCSIIAAPDGAGESGGGASCIFAHQRRVRQKFRAFGWILCYGASLTLIGALAHVVCCGLIRLILMRVEHDRILLRSLLVPDSSSSTIPSHDAGYTRFGLQRDRPHAPLSYDYGETVR